MKDKLLSFETERQQLRYDVKEDNFFMLTSIAAPELDEEAGDERQPIDLVCVIDRSGSMAGSRMKLTKQALDFLVNEMQEKDRISIVLFDNDVDVFYPLTNCTAENKAEMRKEIANIEAQGQTNLSGGLFAGLEELRKREEKNQISSILLFTDGEANHGLTDAHSIVSLLKGRVKHPDIHIRRGKEKESLLQTYLRRKKQNKGKKKKPPAVVKPPPIRRNNPPRPMPVVPMNRSEMPVAHVPSHSEMMMPATPPMMPGAHVPSRTEMMVHPHPVVPSIPKKSAFRKRPPPTNNNNILNFPPPVNPNLPNLPPAPVFPDEVVEGAYNYIAEGINLYTFGFGNSHNEKLLKDLADSSNGIYYFIKTAEDIAESFVDCLGGLMSIVCKDLRVEFQPLNGTIITKVHTVYAKEGIVNGGFAVSLPDLQSEEKRDILLSCVLPNLSDPELRFKAMKVRLTYSDKEKNQKEEELVGIVMRVEEEPENQEKNVNISEQKNRVLVTEAMDEVRELADKKQFEGAKRRCQEVINKVEKSASGRNTFCQALVTDLNDQMSGLTKSNYFQKGFRKQMMCQQMQLQYQRSADVQSSSNRMFSNKKRGALKKKFKGGKY